MGPPSLRELTVLDFPPFFYLCNAKTDHVVGVDGWSMKPCPVHMSALLKPALQKQPNYKGEDAFVWYATDLGDNRGLGLVNRRSGLWLGLQNPSANTLAQDSRDAAFGWRFQDRGAGLCSVSLQSSRYTPFVGRSLSQDGAYNDRYPSGNLNLRAPQNPADPYFAWQLKPLGTLAGPPKYSLSLKERDRVLGGVSQGFGVAAAAFKLLGDIVKASGGGKPEDFAAAVFYTISLAAALASGIASLVDYFSEDTGEDPVELLYREMMPVLTSVGQKVDELPVRNAEGIAAAARAEFSEAAEAVGDALGDLDEQKVTDAHLRHVVENDHGVKEALKNARRNYDLALGLLSTEGAFVPWVQIATESIALETLRLTIDGREAHIARSHARRISREATGHRTAIFEDRMAKVKAGKDTAYETPNEIANADRYRDHIFAAVTKSLGGEMLTSLLSTCTALDKKATEVMPSPPPKKAAAH